MATTNLITKTLGDVLLEHGNGTPDHTSIKGTLYLNKDSGFWYVNLNGNTTWILVNTLTVLDAVNKVPQSLSGTYQTLTNMSLVLSEGTYIINCSGNVTLGSNNEVKIALFEDSTEIDGIDGHTHRVMRINDIVVTPTAKMCFHTSAKVIINSGTVTITCRGLETVGTSSLFVNGRIEALKIG